MQHLGKERGDICDVLSNGLEKKYIYMYTHINRERDRERGERENIRN